MSEPLFTDRETILLTKEGIFLTDGEEITHARTSDAFHRFLGRDADGYFITIGKDFKRINVEDTARFVRQVRFTGSGGDARVEIDLLDGTSEVLDPTTLTYSAERLTCNVKGFAEGFPETAKFLRAAHTEFFMRALEDADGYRISIGEKSFPITRGRP